jgi:hypothetical protein
VSWLRLAHSLACRSRFPSSTVKHSFFPRTNSPVLPRQLFSLSLFFLWPLTFFYVSLMHLQCARACCTHTQHTLNIRYPKLKALCLISHIYTCHGSIDRSSSVFFFWWSKVIFSFPGPQHNPIFLFPWSVPSVESPMGPNIFQKWSNW